MHFSKELLVCNSCVDIQRFLVLVLVVQTKKKYLEFRESCSVKKVLGEFSRFLGKVKEEGEHISK